MDYGNGSIYIGGWLNNNRHGKGRMEKDHKVISGNFKQNAFQLACAVDLDEVMKPINQTDLPRNMEGYLRKRAYIPCEVRVPNLELNNILKPSLNQILKEKCCLGELKGHMYRKLRYLLKDKVALRDISIQVHRAFSVPPNNNEILKIFGDIIPIELETGKTKVAWFGLNFTDKKEPEFNLEHMIITNDCVLGHGTEEFSEKKYTIDGVCGEQGSIFIFLNLGGTIRTLNCISGPNYLTGIDSKENKFFLIPDLHLYKGFFIENDPTNKRVIRYYMRLYDKVIYGFGRDAIGVYMLSGEVYSPVQKDEDQRKIVKFKIHYVAGYSVAMIGRIDKQNEIRGEWESGSLTGKFMLRLSDKYIVEKVLRFVQRHKDTGFAEKDLMEQSITAHLLRDDTASASGNDEDKKLGQTLKSSMNLSKTKLAKLNEIDSHFMSNYSTETAMPEDIFDKPSQIRYKRRGFYDPNDPFNTNYGSGNYNTGSGTDRYQSTGRSKSSKSSKSKDTDSPGTSSRSRSPGSKSSGKSRSNSPRFANASAPEEPEYEYELIAGVPQKKTKKITKKVTKKVTRRVVKKSKDGSKKSKSRSKSPSKKSSSKSIPKKSTTKVSSVARSKTPSKTSSKKVTTSKTGTSKAGTSTKKRSTSKSKSKKKKNLKPKVTVTTTTRVIEVDDPNAPQPILKKKLKVPAPKEVQAQNPNEENVNETEPINIQGISNTNQQTPVKSTTNKGENDKEHTPNGSLILQTKTPTTQKASPPPASRKPATTYSPGSPSHNAAEDQLPLAPHRPILSQLPPDPRIIELEKGVYLNLPEGISDLKRDKIILERKAFVEAVKEEYIQNYYRSIVRRVAAFRDYKKKSATDQPQAPGEKIDGGKNDQPEEKSDMDRVLRANFLFKGYGTDKAMEAAGSDAAGKYTFVNPEWPTLIRSSIMSPQRKLAGMGP